MVLGQKGLDEVGIGLWSSRGQRVLGGESGGGVRSLRSSKGFAFKLAGDALIARLMTNEVLQALCAGDLRNQVRTKSRRKEVNNIP